MRRLAEIKAGLVTNIIVAPDLKTEAEIIDALQKRHGDLMRSGATDAEITAALATFEADLRRDDYADHPDAAGAQIGSGYDAATGQFSAPVVVETFPDLTRKKFEFLLALTGFGDVWDQLAAGAKAGGDLVTYASLMAERSGTTFRHDVTLATVAKFRATAAQIAPSVDLSDTAINAAWHQAQAFKGV